MLTQSSSQTFLSILPDVLEHCIFSFLSLPDLISCSLVSSQLRKIYQRRDWKTAGLSKHMKILEEIYKGGSISLLLWFQSALRYPVLSSLNRFRQHSCLRLAAEGTEM